MPKPKQQYKQQYQTPKMWCITMRPRLWYSNGFLPRSDVLLEDVSKFSVLMSAKKVDL